MKTLLIAAFMLVSSSSLFAKTPEVSNLVKTVFSRSYADAQNVIWATEEDKYYVYFTKDAVHYRMYYDQDANVVLAYKYYEDDKLLPPMILNKIRKEYQGYKIKGTTEVSSENNIEYYPILENGKKIVQLKVSSYGSISVEHKYDQQQN